MSSMLVGNTLFEPILQCVHTATHLVGTFHAAVFTTMVHLYSVKWHFILSFSTRTVFECVG